MAVWNRVRLAAPIGSFGGVTVDERPTAHPIPTHSWLAGLLGAALGIDYTDGERLQGLQDGLEYGVAVHRDPVPLVDYQTADLSRIRERMMADGTPCKRETKAETVVQRRPYWSDIDLTLVLRIDGLDPQEIQQALRHPVFSLHCGRTSCSFSAPLDAGLVEADSLESALRQVAAQRGALLWLPSDWSDFAAVPIAGLRDWSSRRFRGETWWRRIAIAPLEGATA